MTQPTSGSALTTPSHATLHNERVNVLAFGATGDGVTDDTAAIQAAFNSGAAYIYLPNPTSKFFLATGSSVTIPSTVRQIVGPGRWANPVSSKNAYAFTATSLSDFVIRDLGFELRSGATSGGAIKLDSASNVVLSHIASGGISGVTDPTIYVKGGVNCTLEFVQSGGASAPGIQLDSTGATLAFNNANVVRRCRVTSTQGSTTPAIYLSGGSGNAVRDCIVESNRGYGIQLSAEASDTIDNNWYEDNSNHNLLLTSCTRTTVIGNKLQYNHGDVGTAKHIVLTGSANARHLNVIISNIISDASSSGVAIDIGSGVEFTSVIGNRGVGVGNGTTLTDNGSYTYAIGNDSGSTRGDKIKFPISGSTGGAITAGSGGSFKIYSDSETGDTGAPYDGIFVAGDTTAATDGSSSDFFQVTRSGHVVIKTGSGDPGTGKQGANSFILFWDNAAGQVKARCRKNDGSYTVLTLG